MIWAFRKATCALLNIIWDLFSKTKVLVTWQFQMQSEAMFSIYWSVWVYHGYLELLMVIILQLRVKVISQNLIKSIKLFLNYLDFLYNTGLTYSTITLFGTVVILLVSLHINKWQLDKKLGFFLMIIYVLFIALASFYESDVLGASHLPMCSDSKW